MGNSPWFEFKTRGIFLYVSVTKPVASALKKMSYCTYLELLWLLDPGGDSVSVIPTAALRARINIIATSISEAQRPLPVHSHFGCIIRYIVHTLVINSSTVTAPVRYRAHYHRPYGKPHLVLYGPQIAFVRTALNLSPDENCPEDFCIEQAQKTI